MSRRGMYNLIAKIYNLLDYPHEVLYYRHMRRQWIASLRGEKVLEVGVGTGKNLPYYHPSNRVLGIDLSPEMLARAEQVSADCAADITLQHVDGIPWDVPSDFSVAVATFVMCTMADPTPVLDELTQHLQPGGELILFEYGRPEHPAHRKITKLLTALTLPLFGVDFDRAPTREYLDEHWEVVEHEEIQGSFLYVLRLRLRQG